MANIVETLYSWLSFVRHISLRNLLEIVIITFLVYEILVWIKNTRAWTLLKGIVVILGFTVLAYLLRLDTIFWIISKFAFVATTALVIIFQPELRKALEELGSQNLISGILSFDDGKESRAFTERSVNEIVKATFEMAKVKTGALMVIERDVPLSEIERTGIEIDGLISSQLLINIFEHNTPLHDGAVVLSGNKVVSATCYLPLSDNMAISKDLGTRHRAAVGISEVSDSMTVVVSEETGRVSVAENGGLRRVSDSDELRAILSRLTEQEETGGKRFKIWKGRIRNEKKIAK
ncbi:TIGR00159 family protein [Lachnoclostridium sp. An14]|uniref:diadenylate cyclase CdaA n=1 Tax=Lachnoclostridium sp. An14 TaxID=1965562 RepID=UPI000B38CEB8|nr:diadenylate cyclase CdaA [Lachnoclostridium sp. An14]OUQ17014.1 TIGR00159 family protein [Lachnoclostridium sp. An14]